MSHTGMHSSHLSTHISSHTCTEVTGTHIDTHTHVQCAHTQHTFTWTHTLSHKQTLKLPISSLSNVSLSLTNSYPLSHLLTLSLSLSCSLSLQRSKLYDDVRHIVCMRSDNRLLLTLSKMKDIAGNAAEHTHTHCTWYTLPDPIRQAYTQTLSAHTQMLTLTHTHGEIVSYFSSMYTHAHRCTHTRVCVRLAVHRVCVRCWLYHTQLVTQT